MNWNYFLPLIDIKIDIFMEYEEFCINAWINKYSDIRVRIQCYNKNYYRLFVRICLMTIVQSWNFLLE